jgi:hypothetical protein
MREICDQNDIDRAGIQTLQERTRYRDILEQFETTVFDNQSEETTSQFLCEVLDLILPYFAPDLVEIQEIEYADIYAVIRFLQKIYTNWLQYSRQNASKASLSVIDPVLLLISIFGAAASYASEAFNGIVKKFLQLIRSAGLMVFSFISNLMQAEKSATSCATAQYKPHFQFFVAYIFNTVFGPQFSFSLLPFFFNVELRRQALDIAVTLMPASRF